MSMMLGCDPEVFLTNKKGLVSVVGLVEGNKENPWQIPELPKGFTLQQDNVSLEFGIPPAASKEEWVKYLTMVKAAGKRHLKGLSYSSSSCEIFPVEEMQTAEAHVFGCEPDYNAWTGEQNPMPKPPHPLMRSAGGHVHVATNQDARKMVRAMDLFLGLPSLVLDAEGAQRRQLYGKAGAYRPKPYGTEYRTLSNFWMFSTKRMAWVWEQTEKAIKFLEERGEFFDFRVRDAINNGDIVLAKRMMKEYNV